MAELGSVYWIGGGSGGGKSTIARRLAAHFGMVLYDTDKAIADHVRRCDPVQTPLLQKFLAMNMDQRWVDRTPQAMLESFPWFTGEGFDLLADDLALLAGQGQSVVAEGFRLLPRLVAPLLESKSKAVWLVPTAAFREAAFASRGSTWSIPDRTSNPKQALANLLERDGLFTDQVATETELLGLTSIRLDLSMDEETLYRRVTSHFRLAP